MKNSVIDDSYIIFTRLFICNQVHVMALMLKQSFNYERKLCCNKCILFKHELLELYIGYLYNNKSKHIYFYKSNHSGALEFCLCLKLTPPPEFKVGYIVYIYHSFELLCQSSSHSRFVSFILIPCKIILVTIPPKLFINSIILKHFCFINRPATMF